jgi:hypothetical protein
MFGIHMSVLVVVLLALPVAIFFLKGFDKIAGRGPKQIKDGINTHLSKTGY